MVWHGLVYDHWYLFGLVGNAKAVWGNNGKCNRKRRKRAFGVNLIGQVGWVGGSTEGRQVRFGWGQREKKKRSGKKRSGVNGETRVGPHRNTFLHPNQNVTRKKEYMPNSLCIVSNNAPQFGNCFCLYHRGDK